MDQKKFEEAEHIFGWKEMKPGTFIFVDKEVRGFNKWMKPISVRLLKRISGLCQSSTTPRLHFTLGLLAD